MYKKELIHKIGHMTEWRCFPCEVEATLDAFCEAVKEVLQDGGKVVIPDFGTFKMCERAARNGRNPRTGEQINISARRQVKFTASKSLSEALKEGQK